MNELPVFAADQTIVVAEHWREQLWSAVPQRVITSTAEELITYLPTGTRSIYATNRELSDASGLTRNERKLLALKTGVAQAAEVEEAPDKLHVHLPDRWSCVNLGWHPDDGRFLGWYVNFELPAAATPSGLTSKDLVLDMWVDPDGTWHWKDTDDFETAIGDGILASSVRQSLKAETAQILSELEHRTGPFAEHILAMRPESPDPKPKLPAEFGWNGNQWSLPPGRRS